MSGMILTGTTTAVSTSTQRSGIVDSCRRRRNHAVLLLLCKVIPWIARRPARRRDICTDDDPRDVLNGPRVCDRAAANVLRRSAVLGTGAAQEPQQGLAYRPCGCWRRHDTHGRVATCARDRERR